MSTATKIRRHSIAVGATIALRRGEPGPDRASSSSLADHLWPTDLRVRE